MKLKCFPETEDEIKVPLANSNNRKELVDFALSFNGYQWCNKGPEGVSNLFTQVKQKIKEDKLDEVSLEELRCCLFWRQRAHRWNGDEHDIKEYQYWIGLIRNKLC